MQSASRLLRISIHALREEGDYCPECQKAAKIISIHALREEGDATGTTAASAADISIHALREEGDLTRRAKK